jgi:DNA polymerase
MQLVDNALELNRKYTQELKTRMQGITGCENPNSLPQLKAWLRDRTGEQVNTLSKDTVPALMKDTEDSEVLEVLSIRKELGKTSTS